MLKKIILSLSLVVILLLEILVRGGNIAPLIYQILFNQNIELRTSEPQRINILLLGIGGEGHDGPKLTDTIILASVDLKKSEVHLISLPRDMWSFDLDGKINGAYARGEAAKKDGGLTLAKSVVGKITGQNINYVVVIDFSGFVKAVDTLGGIDIDVERSFDDYEYPISGKENDPCDNKEEDLDRLATASSQLDAFPCRYEHLRFEKGINHMDGETALKFVRSRHAKGEEGTDFARSKRQEKVIKAIMQKAFSLNVIANPTKVKSLYDIMGDSIHTDIRTNEFDDFIKLAQRFQDLNIQSIVIDNGDKENNRGGLLTNPAISERFNYEWTLIPRNGSDNYTEIHEFIRCNLNQESCSISEIQ